MSSTSGTVTPASSAETGLGASVNVKSEGTGLTSGSPRRSASLWPSRVPPLARRTERQRTTSSPSPWATRRAKRSLPSASPSSTTSMAATRWRVSTTTPAASAASDSAETIDSDESVVGNIRPSSSVFNSTPRPRNHAATSGAPNLEKAPSSVREPRG